MLFSLFFFYETPNLCQALLHTKNMGLNSIGNLSICFEHFCIQKMGLNSIGNVYICFEHCRIQKNRENSSRKIGFSKGVSAWAPLFLQHPVWGHEAVAGLLLQHGADPNALDKYKHTPLNTTSAPFLLAWHPPHFTASEAVPNAQRKEQAFVLLPKKS